jgi:hypothetical protein
MSLVLLLAAALSPASAAAPAPARPAYRVDNSRSDQDRLNELRIAVRSALARGRIDRATAAEFQLAIERIRRQIIRNGIQVGYRQRLRVRARIDRLVARWEERRAMAADIRSGN